MKKYFALITILALAASVAYGAAPKTKAKPAVKAKTTVKAVTKKPAVKPVSVTPGKFKDVPEDHWAASSVYDLVKLGITKGYPDGTFRGSKPITRYETAIFLSKLAKALEASDVKADITALKSDIAALKKGAGAMSVAGSVDSSWMFGNLLGEKGSIRGAVASYRLKLSAAKELGQGANFKVNLDTMDYGFMDDGQTATGGILATELLDIESNLKLNLATIGLENPIDLKLTYGCGPKEHAADPAGPIPSEIGVTYIRPKPVILASTKLLGADVSGGYVAADISRAGRVLNGQITGTLGYAFEGVPVLNTLKLEATGDYISTGMFSSANRDMRATVALSAPLGEKVEATGTWGLGGSKRETWMVAGQVK
ncbi:MAG: S-layer homology domain-containing protein, partial [Candidatus Margulisbacteria bacterium]|nr:S-layer homology domain-containing protein [Candidatus Margulisiibacteriota bacterium]